MSELSVSFTHLVENLQVVCNDKKKVFSNKVFVTSTPHNILG